MMGMRRVVVSGGSTCLRIYLYTIFVVCFQQYIKFVYFWCRGMITISGCMRKLYMQILFDSSSNKRGKYRDAS